MKPPAHGWPSACANACRASRTAASCWPRAPGPCVAPPLTEATVQTPASIAGTGVWRMGVLERDGLLAQLQAHWVAVRASATGRLVFIEGEAGIGKTTLLRSFAQQLQSEAPLHWGACDA